VLVDWRRGDERELGGRGNVDSDCIHGPSGCLCVGNVCRAEGGHAVVETVGEDEHDLWDLDWAVWVWLVGGGAVDTAVDASVSSGLDVVVEDLLDGALVKAERECWVAQSAANGWVLSWQIVDSAEEDESDLGLVWPNDEAVDYDVSESEEFRPLVGVDGSGLVKHEHEVDWSLAQRLDGAVCACWNGKDGLRWLSDLHLREAVGGSVAQLRLADLLRGRSDPDVLHSSRVAWVHLSVPNASGSPVGDGGRSSSCDVGHLQEEARLSDGQLECAASAAQLVLVSAGVVEDLNHCSSVVILDVWIIKSRHCVCVVVRDFRSEHGSRVHSWGV
jgi:hypothetical protein